LLHDMLQLLAGSNPPPSVQAAAKVMIAAGKVRYNGSAESAQRRIAGKFRFRFGTEPLPDETWGDVCRRNVDDVGQM
jgi:hypothetical protein